LKCSVCGAIALSVVLPACSTPLSDDECHALIARYTARLLADERPEAPPAAVHSAQAAARQLSESHPQCEFAACADQVSRKQYDCAMGAPDVNALERCLVL
jgi:hypothetical protein